jgi:hypothetical protein
MCMEPMNPKKPHYFVFTVDAEIVFFYLFKEAVVCELKKNFAIQC